jgi:ribosome biogenesis GTPase
MKREWDSRSADEEHQDDRVDRERMITRKSIRGELRKRAGPEAADASKPAGASNEEGVVEGVVTKIASGSVRVAVAGKSFLCRLRGAFKQFEVEERSIVAVGDRVNVIPRGAQEWLVTEVLPRRTKLSRLDPQLRSAEKVVVANVDQVVIVASVREPPLRARLIDRYLVVCQKNGFEALICLNKIDLAGEEEYRPVMDVYSGLGYKVVCASAQDGRGMDELRAAIALKSNVFTGHSGVGKSSILSRLQPGLELPSAPVTSYGRGRHRTSFAELIPLDFGGFVVDTPGIREFGLWRIEPGELEVGFREIAPLVGDCKFQNCSHGTELGCAVRKAVEEGRISALRYESYLLLLKELFDKREY